MITEQIRSMPNMLETMRRGFFGRAGRPMPEKQSLSGPKLHKMMNDAPFIITSPTHALEIVNMPGLSLELEEDGKAWPLRTLRIDMLTYNRLALHSTSRGYMVSPAMICENMGEISNLPERIRPMRMTIGNILFTEFDPGQFAASLLLGKDTETASMLFERRLFELRAFGIEPTLPQHWMGTLLNPSGSLSEKADLLSDIMCAQTILTFEMAFDAFPLKVERNPAGEHGIAYYKADFVKEIDMGEDQLEVR